MLYSTNDRVQQNALKINDKIIRFLHSVICYLCHNLCQMQLPSKYKVMLKKVYIKSQIRYYFKLFKHVHGKMETFE